MKRPNGSGTVYRLKDARRRKPWIASVTGTCEDGFRFRKIIGYFETRKDALEALENWRADPTDLRYAHATFKDVWTMYYAEAENTASKSTLKNYRSGFNACASLHDRIFSELRAADLQKCIDESGKNAPTQETMRKALSNMYKFALKNDIARKDYAEFISISKRAENPDKRPHIPYTDEEIRKLWDDQDNDLAAFQLMLIYSGCRISELIDLSPAEDVDLEEQCFTIRQAKTKAGIRTVPIADKVLPLWQRLANPTREAIMIGDTGKAINYQRIRVLWDRYNESIGINHYPHDCRHTCVTRLSSAGVSQTIIKKIVGHSDGDVTSEVYDHKTIEELRDAVNMI